MHQQAEKGVGVCGTPDCSKCRFEWKRGKLVPARKFYDFGIKNILQRMMMREDAPIHEGEPPPFLSHHPLTSRVRLHPFAAAAWN